MTITDPGRPRSGVATLARSLVAVGTAATLAISLLAVGQTARAAGPAPVGLGTAAAFAVLAGTPAVTNTGSTTITGDVGISPAAAVTGFPPGTLSGTIHTADAVALQAKTDLATAYLDAAGRPSTATHGTLGGLTLVSGVYNAGGVTLDLTGTLTLDGQNDPSSVWVFQATSDLITASSSSVRLINGASACNVFWQVTSSATLGSGSTFVGTIMALTSITLNSGASVNGRALARNGAVTLINDRIGASTCSTTTPSPTPSTSPIPSPALAPSPSSGTTPTPSLITGPTSGTTPPPTATLATSDRPGSGPSLVVLVGIFLLALVVVTGQVSMRARRTR